MVIMEEDDISSEEDGDLEPKPAQTISTQQRLLGRPFSLFIPKAYRHRLDSATHLKERQEGPRIICVDGNIAVGKSTVLDTLELEGYKVIREPVHEWSDTLKLFYEDKARWAFTLQVVILTSYRKIYRDAKVCAADTRHKYYPTRETFPHASDTATLRAA